MNTIEWPEHINRERAGISREMAKRAFAEWDPARGYMGLAFILERMTGEPVNHGYDRIAGAMVQRARKAGVIRYLGKGKWERVE